MRIKIQNVIKRFIAFAATVLSLQCVSGWDQLKMWRKVFMQTPIFTERSYLALQQVFFCSKHLTNIRPGDQGTECISGLF